jgi:hypothetical protein
MIRVTDGLAKFFNGLVEILRSGHAQLREAGAEVPGGIKETGDPVVCTPVKGCGAELALLRIQLAYIFSLELEMHVLCD